MNQNTEKNFYYVSSDGAKSTLKDIFDKTDMNEIEIKETYTEMESIINERLENGTNRMKDFNNSRKTIEIITVRLIYKINVRNRSFSTQKDKDELINEVIGHSLNWHSNISEALETYNVDFANNNDNNPSDSVEETEKTIDVSRSDLDKNMNEEVSRSEISDFIEQKISGISTEKIVNLLNECDKNGIVELRNSISEEDRIVNFEEEISAYVSDFKNNHASKFAQDIVSMISKEEIEDITSPDGLIDKYSQRGKNSMYQMGRTVSRTYAKGCGHPVMVWFCISVLIFLSITYYNTGDIPVSEMAHIGEQIFSVAFGS